MLAVLRLLRNGDMHNNLPTSYASTTHLAVLIMRPFVCIKGTIACSTGGSFWKLIGDLRAA